jgi:hypothetical protein
LVGYHAAWWYRLLARMGVVSFAAFLVVAVVGGITSGDQGPPFGWREAVLIWGPAVLYGAVAYRTMEDPRPPKEWIPLKLWRSNAENWGLAVGLGVFWTTVWITRPVMGLVAAFIDHLVFLPA